MDSLPLWGSVPLGIMKLWPHEVYQEPALSLKAFLFHLLACCGILKLLGKKEVIVNFPCNNTFLNVDQDTGWSWSWDEGSLLPVLVGVCSVSIKSS